MFVLTLRCFKCNASFISLELYDFDFMLVTTFNWLERYSYMWYSSA